jgi:hypothetical protein
MSSEPDGRWCAHTLKNLRALPLGWVANKGPTSRRQIPPVTDEEQLEAVRAPSSHCDAGWVYSEGGLGLLSAETTSISGRRDVAVNSAVTCSSHTSAMWFGAVTTSCGCFVCYRAGRSLVGSLPPPS